MPLMRLIPLCFLFFLAGAAFAAEDIRLATWNIERLGQGTNKSFEALGRIGADFDFLAVQEVMSAAGLYLFRDALEAESGESWSLLYSHRVGRGPAYAEKYAFVWRDSRIRYVDGAVVYLDLLDTLAREPYAARFEVVDGSFRFVAANIHILFGRSVHDRLPEIEYLSNLWEWLIETFPDDKDNIFFFGDFNLAPTHEAFSGLRQHAVPAVTRGATTISTIEGRFANLYDNIWISRSNKLSINYSAIVPFPRAIGFTHEQARRHVSDHAPVYVSIASGQFPPRRVGAGRLPVVASKIQPRDWLPPANEVGPSSTPYQGNRRSMIFHHPECPGYGSVSQGNLVILATREQALRAGFRKARNCDW